MTHIVIDGRELRTSTGRYVERLLHYLQKIDTENDYTVLLKPADIDGWAPTNSNFKKVTCPYKEFTVSEQTKLKKQIESLNPDLVHFTLPQQPAWYKGKVVTTIHDLTTLRFTNPDKNWLAFKFKQKVYKWLMKRVARKSIYVLTGAEFVKNDVVQFANINPDKVVVTYESADPIEDPAEPIQDLQGLEFIMYVGRPTPHKNLDRLVEAFASIQQQNPNLWLVLAGRKDRNYERFANQLKKRGIVNVYFTDYVSEGQLRWLYENTKLYIFPSLSEGFGLPGLEAMVQGAPVASSNATCLPEVYGDAAIYFDPLNVSEIAQAIQKVLSDENLRTELINKGKQQAAKYSWQRMAEQTLDVYKKSLGA